MFASSEMRKKNVFPESTFKKMPWRGPDPAGAWKGALSVRRLVLGSMLKTRTRSAPRSGTTMKDPVGSRITSCG